MMAGPSAARWRVSIKRRQPSWVQQDVGGSVLRCCDRRRSHRNRRPSPASWQCRAGGNHSRTARPRTAQGNRRRPIAKKTDANRLARSNNVAARYRRGAMRKRSRRSRVGRATLARRIVVSLHRCRRSICRTGALLSQQPSQTNDRGGDSDGRRIAPTIVRPSASP